MKGLLNKLVLLTLIAAPSFAMDQKQQQEPGLSGQDELILKAADRIEQAASPETAAQNAVVAGLVGGAISNISWLWEKALACGSYLADTRLARWSAAALAVPFDYTLGLAAQKSGISNTLANSNFAQSNPYYLASAGSYAYSAARYAVGLAAFYAAYKAYKYVTTPASQKLDGSQATPKKKKLSAKALKEKEALFAALDAFVQKMETEKIKNNPNLSNSAEVQALKKFDFLKQISFVVNENTNQASIQACAGNDSCLDVIIKASGEFDNPPVRDQKQKLEVRMMLTGAFGAMIGEIKAGYDAFVKDAKANAKKQSNQQAKNQPVAQAALAPKAAQPQVQKPAVKQVLALQQLLALLDAYSRKIAAKMTFNDAKLVDAVELRYLAGNDFLCQSTVMNGAIVAKARDQRSCFGLISLLAAEVDNAQSQQAIAQNKVILQNVINSIKAALGNIR